MWFLFNHKVFKNFFQLMWSESIISSFTFFKMHLRYDQLLIRLVAQYIRYKKRLLFCFSNPTTNRPIFSMKKLDQLWSDIRKKILWLLAFWCYVVEWQYLCQHRMTIESGQKWKNIPRVIAPILNRCRFFS